MNITDLTMPIVHGDGRFGHTNSFYDGPHTFERDGLQSSNFSMFAHFGTHVDAPLHVFPDGQSIEAVSLTSLIGHAAVFDLSDTTAMSGITATMLEDRDPELGKSDIAVLRTDWTDKAWGTKDFLANAPYLTESGANWLVEREPTAIVYDFPEEHGVRNDDFGGKDCVVHHIILGNGIYNIEYVVNLARLTGSEFTIMAFPLPLAGLDGAPARVIAVEEPRAVED